MLTNIYRAGLETGILMKILPRLKTKQQCFETKQRLVISSGVKTNEEMKMFTEHFAIKKKNVHPLERMYKTQSWCEHVPESQRISSSERSVEFRKDVGEDSLYWSLKNKSGFTRKLRERRQKNNFVTEKYSLGTEPYTICLTAEERIF
jgi:hypothetical protein